MKDTTATARPWDTFAITAIGTFFGQVLPFLAGDAIRVWLLVRVQLLLRDALAGVVIDRAVGVFVLLVVAFLALMSPSALAALGGFHNRVVVAIGGILAFATLGILAAPSLADLLGRWPRTGSLANLAAQIGRVLLSRRAPAIFGAALAIHLLGIVAVLLLGQAQGLTLPFDDAAVLFSVLMIATIVPISVGGWGPRELAVTALLQSHGFPPERALLFSVSFGFALMLAALPGGLVWALYQPRSTNTAVLEHAPADG